MIAALLSFLASQYNRVTEWFGWLYDQGRTVVLNAYWWAYNEATHAYYNAVNYAVSLRDAVVSWVNTQVHNLTTWIANARTDASAWVESAKAWAYNWIQYHYALARYYAESLVVGAIGQINTLRGQIRDILRDALPGLIDALLPGLRWLLGVRDRIRYIIDLLDDNLVAKLVNFFTSSYKTAMAFAADPLGFVCGLLWGVLVELMSWSIAYALGSTKYDLPPLPPWVVGGTKDT